MKILKALAVCSVTALAAVSLAACKPAAKEISCKDLFSPSFEGLSGNANLYSYTYVTDEKKSEAINSLLGEVDTSKLSSSQYDEYSNAKRYISALLNDVTFKVDDYSSDKKYQNGDKLTVTAQISEEKAKLMNINLKDTSFEYTVEGINEGTKIDPFEKLKITYSGISSDGTAKYDKSECPQFVKNDVYFDISSNYDLSNGDKITVTASYSEYSANKAEVIITQTEKEYTVSGLSEYPSSLDEVNLSVVNTKIEDKAKEYFKSNYTAGDTIYTSDSVTVEVTKSTYTPFKKYFLTRTSDNSYYDHNIYFVAYEINSEGTVKYDTSKLKKGTTVGVKQYRLYYVENIVVDSNKSVVNDDNHSIYVHSNYSNYDDIKDIEDLLNGSSYSDYTVAEVK